MNEQQKLNILKHLLQIQAVTKEGKSTQYFLHTFNTMLKSAKLVNANWRLDSKNYSKEQQIIADIFFAYGSPKEPRHAFNLIKFNSEEEFLMHTVNYLNENDKNNFLLNSIYQELTAPLYEKYENNERELQKIYGYPLDNDLITQNQGIPSLTNLAANAVAKKNDFESLPIDELKKDLQNLGLEINEAKVSLINHQIQLELYNQLENPEIDDQESIAPINLLFDPILSASKQQALDLYRQGASFSAEPLGWKEGLEEDLVNDSLNNIDRGEEYSNCAENLGSSSQSIDSPKKEQKAEQNQQRTQTQDTSESTCSYH